jgi:hypothetical protein
MLFLSFLGTTAFTLWVVFYGGAEEIEGKLSSILLLGPLASLLTASHLKLYVCFLWVIQLFLFGASVFAK